MSDDPYAGISGRFYSFYIARPRIARLVGRALWGSDLRPLYTSLTELGGLRPGSVVVDIACGAGLALAWLPAARSIRYLGIDNSPSMIARARRRARQLGLDDVEFLLGDVHSLPLRDRVADTCLLYNGLPAFARPATVVREAARCLRPLGELRGSALVRGAVARADRSMAREAARAGGTMGSDGTADDLQRWLADAGLQDIVVSTSGAMAAFTGRRPRTG